MTTTTTNRASAFTVLPSEISKNNTLTLRSARNSIYIASNHGPDIHLYLVNSNKQTKCFQFI